MRRLVPFILLCAALVPMSQAVRVLSDVDYLGDGRAEKLDLYLPNSAGQGEPLPAVMLIHGGGWAGGDKASKRMRAIALPLAEAGYVVISINYDLNVGTRDPDTRKYSLSYLAWPRNFYDCKSALRYIRAHADEYGIDPQRIALLGTSAGAHLAMLVAATANDPEMNRHGLYLEQSNAVACVINLYGIFDTEGQALSPLMGSAPDVKERWGKASSPKSYFDADLPPMLILHGTEDKTIAIEHSRALADHLASLGVSYWYLEIAGAPHSFDLQPEQIDLRPIVLQFLGRYL